MTSQAIDPAAAHAPVYTRSAPALGHSGMTVDRYYGTHAFGGLIPLAPYIFLHDRQTALIWSVVATLSALAAFGYIKASFTGMSAGRSAFRTAVIGGLAAAAAFLIAKAVS